MVGLPPLGHRCSRTGHGASIIGTESDCSLLSCHYRYRRYSVDLSQHLPSVGISQTFHVEGVNRRRHFHRNGTSSKIFSCSLIANHRFGLSIILFARRRCASPAFPASAKAVKPPTHRIRGAGSTHMLCCSPNHSNCLFFSRLSTMAFRPPTISHAGTRGPTSVFSRRILL